MLRYWTFSPRFATAPVCGLPFARCQLLLPSSPAWNRFVTQLACPTDQGVKAMSFFSPKPSRFFNFEVSVRSFPSMTLFALSAPPSEPLPFFGVAPSSVPRFRRSAAGRPRSIW